jgi:tetratricopeptide (TPR) repeat protein
MGFGKKTDPDQKKTFDLDKSYKYIIKPAVEAAAYTCRRADEIQHAGNINVPMYEQLFEADLVIADLSTANLNAFFELGVRYALKPRTTIVIAEKGFKLPFDIGQVVVRSYEHLGDGIDFGEVERMRAELTTACREVAAANRTDSPVYTFLTRLSPPALRELAEETRNVADAQNARSLAAATDENEKAALTLPFAALMESAMAARARGDFKKARAILSGVRAAQGEQVDPFVIQQLALSTYKSKDLEPRAALMEAKACMNELSPKSSSDPETLGLWGAIHKRLHEIDSTTEDRRAALDEAIAGYEKGFYLKNDYYNGINYAFLLDARAAESTGNEAIADRVQAQRVRKRVLQIVDDLLAIGIKGESEDSKAEQEYWIRATRVEALLGLGRFDESAAAFEETKAMTPPPEAWMIDSTNGQLEKLRKLLGAPIEV